MTDQGRPPPQPNYPPAAVMKAQPIYCNVFTVISTPHIVRIAFGESFGAPVEASAFHTAVALTPEDARNLVRSLAGILGIQLGPEGT
jgi:hypothetical protein